MKHYRYYSPRLWVMIVGCLIVGNLQAGNIAVFCALDADISSLKQHIGGTSSVYHAGTRKVTLIENEKCSLHIARMRPGAARSAVDATSVLAGRSWQLVITVGPCGALRQDLETGTWGMVVRSRYWPAITQNREFRAVSQMNADHPLASVLPELPQWSSVSSEVFIGESGLRAEILSRTQCDVVEMNLEGIHAAVDNHEVDAIHLRVISDYANESAEKDFADFCKNYRGKGGAMVSRLINQLPADPKSIRNYDRLKDLLDKE